jgi:hypothetical protein
VLTITAASERSGITQYSIAAHLAASELAGLHIGTKDAWRIPLPALEQLQRRRTPYTAQQLAHLFGVNDWVAREWLTRRMLCRRNHSRSHDTCPNYWCLNEFVSNMLTLPGVSAAAWLEARQHDPQPLVPARDLQGSAWMTTPEVITAALDLGMLDGIWLPIPAGNNFLHVTYKSAHVFIRWRDRLYASYAQSTRQ